ncbi:hypothetical protein DN069_32385 [Streptacidiphilus pinicola]|uniref:Tat pathway signal sequence domain protein n=1 Tax=Streptacidiphilus pinicola TaxID=2219663 RepID=A0A2X0I9F0_9ACTN|nr:hypothetical protein [Streptacidiphilus pinicola]RAG81554.1 hypothetical protein DN069_32385 [Streptacidiphilus pinicola]
MRHRIAAAALAGSCALAAIAIPAAASAATPHPAIRSSVTDMAIGLIGRQHFSIRVSAFDAKGIRSIHAFIWPLAANGARPTPALVAASAMGTVRSRTATSETIGFDYTYDDAKRFEPDYIAGEFGIAVLATANDGTTTYVPKAATYFFRFADALNAKASTGAVRKGARVTVKGRLERADWDLNTWRPNTGPWVALQFRKAGTNTWVTESWAKTNGTGALAATATDHASGWWRLSYGGDLTCAPTVSAQTWITAR